MRTWVTILAAGAVLGCATPQMTAVDLAGRAQRNMIEAQQDLAGKQVVVSGVVQNTTLATREQIAIRGSMYSAAVTTNQDQVPIVVLQPGTVFCYFEPTDIDDAAHVKPGDAVAFDCFVDSFRPGNSGPQALLSGCRSKR